MPTASVSVAVKNSILLFLIIMCLHFLIKNTIAETTEGFSGSECAANAAPPAPAPTESVLLPSSVLRAAPLLKEDVMIESEKVCATSSIKECPAVSEMPVLKNDEDDLYQYVFGESLESKTECSAPKSDKSTSLAASPKQQKAPCSEGFGDISGNMIIGTYKNEKALNGGEMFNGLLGYDGGDSMYEEL